MIDVGQDGGGHAKRADDGPTGSAAPVHPLMTTPAVRAIVEDWRERQAAVKARVKLTLQAQALCRRMAGGDKAAAAKLYAAGRKGTDPVVAVLIAPYLDAMAPFATRIAALDRGLEKRAATLPVAAWARGVRGFGLGGLAKTVGELGDLSAYAKGDAGIWKRAGLAVIDGGRQRRVAGDAALLHGYSPARRSVFWNIAETMLKGQGKDDTAGPYRLIYDARKALEATRTDSAAHAHARAMRFMTKRLLRDLRRAWDATP